MSRRPLRPALPHGKPGATRGIPITRTGIAAQARTFTCACAVRPTFGGVAEASAFYHQYARMNADRCARDDQKREFRQL